MGRAPGAVPTCKLPCHAKVALCSLLGLLGSTEHSGKTETKKEKSETTDLSHSPSVCGTTFETAIYFVLFYRNQSTYDNIHRFKNLIKPVFFILTQCGTE